MIQLKYTIRWEHIGDNFYGVTNDDNGRLLPGVITLNEVGYDIVQQLCSPTTPSEITKALLSTYEAEEAEIQVYVNEVLQYLKEQNLLKTLPPPIYKDRYSQ